ncbi:hypothetical protein QUV83_07585 [Cellulomonas cellasea]|uniref:hypothetical protein n=1 Tax=Cellulomonas cellasea TaxID=43670 RepID=UPI0025A380DD|nr:hypothetical protein [Cellulomonas cellasea]MDM8084618.1 hypothetical protein [Cellulomonas cellasea]
MNSTTPAGQHDGPDDPDYDTDGDPDNMNPRSGVNAKSGAADDPDYDTDGDPDNMNPRHDSNAEQR